MKSFQEFIKESNKVNENYVISIYSFMDGKRMLVSKDWQHEYQEIPKKTRVESIKKFIKDNPKLDVVFKTKSDATKAMRQKKKKRAGTRKTDSYEIINIGEY